MPETYRLPAEWEPHEATWISWPKNLLTFEEKILPNVEQIYVQIALGLNAGEIVNILVDDEKSENHARKLIEEKGSSKNIRFHRIKTGDVWIRDYGPIFVRSKAGLVATKWVYNAYGGKYDDLLEDDLVVDRISPIINKPVIKPGIILEGGSIDVNGKGTMLTTEQCLLNQNRNSKLSKDDIEKHLKTNFGVSNIIWLKDGVVGDDTDGHVDDISRFVNEITILTAFEENKKDENYVALKHNFELLQNSHDQDSKPMNVKKLPMPKPVKSQYGRLPASYANFYIGNSAVLLPVFGDKNDSKAIELLEGSFPKRKVIPIDCTYLAYGFGGIHCVTQQQPK